MSKKEKRKVSKGTGLRYASTRPRPITPIRRVQPPPPSPDETVLRRRIPKFADHERFKADFERAMRLYFNREPDQNTPLPMNENERPGFSEWYFFDYVTLTGPRIIDYFVAEVDLPASQRQMLDDWIITNRLRLFETQAVKPGIGVTMQDLLSGEILEINDISASYILVRWAIFLARPLLTLGRLSFTGSGVVFSPQEKTTLLGAIEPLWAAYQADRPNPNLSDFYRDHSLDLRRAAEHVREESSKPPRMFTPEGHVAVLAKAWFSVQGDPNELVDLLDDSQEFVYGGESEADPDALHYLWLLRGRSRVVENPNSPAERSVMLRGEWTEGAGQPIYRTLGDLTVGPVTIVLECLSRERLNSGKVMLERALGPLIRFQGERVESINELKAKQAPESQPAAPREPRSMLKPPNTGEVDQYLREYQQLSWLDEPAIGFGGLSPREAVKSPEGRHQIIEALKVMEYQEDLRLRAGEPKIMDVTRLRQELGLD